MSLGGLKIAKVQSPLKENQLTALSLSAYACRTPQSMGYQLHVVTVIIGLATLNTFLAL